MLGKTVNGFTLFIVCAFWCTSGMSGMATSDDKHGTLEGMDFLSSGSERTEFGEGTVVLEGIMMMLAPHKSNAVQRL